MRVSTDSDRQSTDLQRDALLAVGVDARHLFEDRASGARDDRPRLTEALEFLQPGDVLVVWKLDRLGRSLSHLLAIVNALKEKRVAFRSLTENLDTMTPSGELLFKRTTLIETPARDRAHAGRTDEKTGTEVPVLLLRSGF